MGRLVIMTVGKTHSGKTTFAKKLERDLHNSVVIDRDDHAEFINTFYKNMLPKQGANTLKNAITRTIVDYATNETDFHLILCISYLSHKVRLDLLEHFHQNGFVSILVRFDLPDHILQTRVANRQRSTKIFRTASSFEEVLKRQEAESHNDDAIAPEEEEANYLAIIKDSSEVHIAIQEITNITQSLH